MVELLILFIMAFFLYSSKKRTGKWINPLSIVLIFWSFWLIMSIANSFNLYEVQMSTYLYFILFLMLFSIGFLLVARNIRERNSRFAEKRFKRKSIILLIEVITLVSLLYFYFKYNRLFEILGALEARNIKFDIGLLFSNTYEYLFFNIIIASIVYLSFILSLSRYLYYKKIDLMLIISLINIYIYSSIGLGRLAIFEAIVFILLGYVFSLIYRVGKSNLPNKLMMLCISLLGIVIILNVTTKRLNTTIEEKGILETITFTFEQGFLYFIGPINAFNQFLIMKVPDVVGYTYGRSTLGGLEYFISLIFSFIGYPFVSANDLTGSFTRPPISIGENQEFNAFYTSLMNYYMDFGILGVILFAFLFGLFVGLAWNVYIKNGNVYTLSLLIFVCYTAISSELRLPFANLSVWIILFTLIILVKFNKNVKIETY